MGANILLFVSSNILGAIDFYIADRRQRRSVLETRQSLEVKITLESENRQQVCYLATPLTFQYINAGSVAEFLKMSAISCRFSNHLLVLVLLVILLVAKRRSCLSFVLVQLK